MKKFLLVLAMPVLFSLTANAQEDSESRKPKAGNVTTEVGINIFTTHNYYNYSGYYGFNSGLGTYFSNFFNNLRGRYFTSESFAYRLSLNPNFQSRKGNSDQNSNITNITINPGFEKHFKGTTKLSPFIGGEISFNLRKVNSSYIDPSTNIKVEVKNGIKLPGTSLIDFSRTSIGINGIVGTDYYFAQKFYLGLEIGYGIFYYKEKDVEEIHSNRPVTTTSGGKGFAFQPYVNPGLRLGFVF